MDWHIWLYLFIGVAFIGMAAMGYSYFSEVYWPDTAEVPKPDPKGKGPEVIITPPTGEGGEGSGSSSSSSGGSGARRSALSVVKSMVVNLGNTYNTVKSYANPFSWLPTRGDNSRVVNAFLADQSSWNKTDFNYYPHTSNNPYDPWYKKLRLAILGETEAEKVARADWKTEVFYKNAPSHEQKVPAYVGVHLSPNLNKASLKPVNKIPEWSPDLDPSNLPPAPGTISAGVGISGTDNSAAWWGHQSTRTKLSSLPSTPDLNPLKSLPLVGGETLPPLSSNKGGGILEANLAQEWAKAASLPASPAESIPSLDSVTEKEWSMPKPNEEGVIKQTQSSLSGGGSEEALTKKQRLVSIRDARKAKLLEAKKW